ncbi:serine/threonine-protein kinase Nek5-like [Octopus sinensis]|uniref:non-specific serine/threonine protein kinase n=1 Tax=Octopus sinensis TaxID=2607531 RepID=A0A6P7TP19_9MOLL|nr:serine/threonine-protein kinase Nek5-like [Octopus sinensis]
MSYYRILKKLGSGTFGNVFLVVNVWTKKQYALKEIGNVRNEKQLASAMKEISVLKELNHPFIVQFYGYFHKNGCLSIVLEYCSFGDLSKVIQYFRFSSSSQWMIYNLISQVVLGLRYMHSRNIIHRDLKPQNILVSKNFSVKISDFGLARKLLTPFAYTCAGTVLYMSPEVYSGKPYDFTTDIWSFGVVLYEVITQRRPFSEVSQMLKAAYDPLDKRIARDLRYIVFWSLHLDPKKRMTLHTILRCTSISTFIHKHYPHYI